MGKPVNIFIDQFDGGMVQDLRDGWVSNGSVFTTNKFALTKHFDVFTQEKKKLIPLAKTAAWAGEQKLYDVVKWLFVPTGYTSGIPVTWKLIGYGSDSGKAAIYIRDIADTAWESQLGSSTSAQRDETVFFYYYSDAAYLYFWTAAGVLSRMSLAGVLTEAYKTSIAYTSPLAEPVYHPGDNSAYFFANNIVYRLLPTDSWEGTVLTLSKYFRIMTACAYGDYLAIGAVERNSPNEKSWVFLWDRDSSLETITQRIDFGEGTLRHLANLNGNLVGVVDFHVADAVGLKNGKVCVRIANGNSYITTAELNTDATVSGGAFQTTSNKVVSNNVLYFPMRLPLGSDQRMGIWAVNEKGNIALSLVEEEATQSTSSIEGIQLIGNKWYIAHSDDGSNNESDDNGAFSTSQYSTYDSLIFNAGDSSIKKKLVGVSLTHEPIPSTGEATLQYRIDENINNGAWTTVFQNTTENSLSKDAVRTAAGATLPEFKEIQFRILSKGAVITGLKAKVETIGKESYE